MKFFYSKVFIKQLFLATIIFSLIVLASIVFLFFYTNQTSRVVVPDLVGVSINEIDELIIESNLRYEIIDSSFYNEEFDKNTVIEQIPIANKEVKKNRKIYLTTNPSSYGDVILPEIIQLTKRNAVTTLMALELNFQIHAAKTTNIENKMSSINVLKKMKNYFVKYIFLLEYIS